MNQGYLNLILLESVDPFIQDGNNNIVDLRNQISILKHLLSFPDNSQNYVFLLLPEELVPLPTRDIILVRVNWIIEE